MVAAVAPQMKPWPAPPHARLLVTPSGCIRSIRPRNRPRYSPWLLFTPAHRNSKHRGLPLIRGGKYGIGNRQVKGAGGT